MRIVALLFSAFAWGGLAPAFAETYASVYDCRFRVSGEGGEETTAVIAIDGSGRPFTFDRTPESEKVVRQPVSARKDGANHVIYTYTFNVPHPDRGVARIDAQIRVPVAGGAARISLRGRGYSGNPRGTGTCELSQNVRIDI